MDKIFFYLCNFPPRRCDLWCSVSIMVFCQYYGVLSVLWCSVSIMVFCQYYGVLSVLWCSISVMVFCQCYGVLSVLWCSVSVMVQQCATGQTGPVRSYQRGSEKKLPCLQPRIEPCSFSPQSVTNSATVLNCGLCGTVPCSGVGSASASASTVCQHG